MHLQSAEHMRSELCPLLQSRFASVPRVQQQHYCTRLVGARSLLVSAVQQQCHVQCQYMLIHFYFLHHEKQESSQAKQGTGNA